MTTEEIQKLIIRNKIWFAGFIGFISGVALMTLIQILISNIHPQLGVIFIKPSEVSQIAGSIKYVVCG
jgi:hypothetical protein